MASEVVPYPADHELALARVHRVIQLISTHPDIRDKDVEAALVKDGVGPVDAWLLTLFVPAALSYPIIRMLGVTNFPDSYIVVDRSGQLVFRPLAGERYFTVALAWAEALFAMAPEDRPLNVEQWSAVAGRSSEMDSVNKLLANEGPEVLPRAVMHPTMLLGHTAEEIAASRPSGRSWWKFWK